MSKNVDIPRCTCNTGVGGKTLNRFDHSVLALR